MAADPITDTDRQRVAELHTAGKGRNDIATEIGRSAGTVSKIAKALGLSFDREATRAATAAKVADAASRRAALALDLLGDAEKLRSQLWTEATVFAFGGKDNIYAEHPLPEPPAVDKLKLLQAAGTAIRDSLRLTEFDAAAGTTDAKAMLTDLAERLGAAWRGEAGGTDA